MATHENLPYSNLLLIITCLLSYLLPLQAIKHADKAAGFTINLIHRDSPLSPYYNPSSTNKWPKLNDAIHRSLSRFNPPTNTTTPLQYSSPLIIPSNGEYLMNLSIGTPPTPFLAILDTGSDLTWTQCKPCISCYDQPLEIFNPSDSSTYRPLSCESDQCLEVSGSERSCKNNEDTCSYNYGYGDGSSAMGELGMDTLILDPSQPEGTSISNVIIGCGRENNGTFPLFHGSGLVAFGRGSLSLVSQLYDYIDGKFSYCLAPMDETNSISKISFGAPNAVVSGTDVVSTPIVETTSDDLFYYVTLEGITVGNETLSFRKNITNNITQGNMFVDSGTTLTNLPEELYSFLVESLKIFIINAETVPDPSNELDLCYRSEDLDYVADVPNITVHFKDADLLLNKEAAIFTLVDDGVVCLAMTNTTDTGIFGNLAQINYLVGFDLVDEKVSFKPTDCTKYV